MKFQIYPEHQPEPNPERNKPPQWRWRLVATNGNIIADSGEAYDSPSNTRRAVRKLEDSLQIDQGMRADIEVLKK